LLCKPIRHPVTLEHTAAVALVVVQMLGSKLNAHIAAEAKFFRSIKAR